MKKTHMIWVDNVKILACFLVAIGHFFQSMCTSGILAENAFFQWFDQTIYYFHVQLFFICSGYLYQKYSVVDSFAAWKENAVKKLITLGVPYFTFSLVTWGLKRVFSGSVNMEAHSLWYDLFVHPMSPYWYLFALFFVFLITPTFSDRKACGIGLVISVILKIIAGSVDNYVVMTIAGYQIWFVIGIALCVFDVPARAENGRIRGEILLVVFLMLSVLTWYASVSIETVSFLMGSLGCSAVLVIFWRADGKTNLLARYTMPVYLMHTIFAAGFRSVLLKMRVTDPMIHIVVGLAASFLCPVIAAEIMKQTRLDFFFDPGKYMRRKK